MTNRSRPDTDDRTGLDVVSTDGRLHVRHAAASEAPFFFWKKVPMRIQGRTLRASNLAERRVLKSLGVDTLRVPRRLNPFALARQVRKIAGGTGGDLPALRAALNTHERRVAPALPDSTSEPGDGELTA